jgi:outer membrane protein TolC
MKRYVLVIILVLGVLVAWADEVRKITLDEAILLARSQSVDAAMALNELKSAYWEYRSYKANLLPEVNFTATLPSYNKRYSAYQQSDGSYTFVRNNNIGMSGELSITQNIWLTGGTLSLNTSLDFLRQVDGNVGNRYMSVPVALTLNQPIFGVNSMKWNRKIEPLRYAEARARFLSETEEVAMLAVQYFFNLLETREKVNIAKQNLANAEKLYEVAQAKRKMGQISENDLLQIELNTLTARQSLTSNESSMKNAMFQLRSFLDIEENVEIEPLMPEEISLDAVNYDEVRTKAMYSNAHAKNIRRRQLEADYAVAKAKGNLRKVNLFAQIGYTGTNNQLAESYRGLKDNQVVEIGISIPILDWGKRKGQVKVAQSNREVVQSRLKKESIDFYQNLFILVERFNNQREQLNLAQRADDIAQRRYNTNVQTFMVGKISTLDLNDSQENKDAARQEYINALFYYWYYYYQIRSITLWDFAGNYSINADFEKIVKI